MNSRRTSDHPPPQRELLILETTYAELQFANTSSRFVCERENQEARWQIIEYGEARTTTTHVKLLGRQVLTIWRFAPIAIASYCRQLPEAFSLLADISLEAP